jgi:V/A-type H+-transporting ATPase subunit E
MVDGDVEINCTFETLVRLQRETLERDVAKVLFE